MESATPLVAAAPAASPSSNLTTKHIRGSSLLLAGRLLSMAAGFAVQVLTVRYLSKSDYGAFAYALSVVSLGTSFVLLGLDKTITRFVPIYHEQHDYNRLFGAILMMVGAVVTLGLALILGLYAFQGWLGQALVKDHLSLTLLLIVIALAAVRALDELLVGLFAIFANPRAIFFRRYLLAPGLELLVVVLLILAHSDVFFLAGGYMAAGVFGIVLYLWILMRALRQQGLFQHFNLRTITLPVREVFSFSLPLLASDFVFVLRSSLVVVLLEYFQSTTDVAAFRAVLPVARLNMVVLQSFTFLFMPLASRMFARKEWQGINDLYWQSATWIAMISFPVFLVTFSLAQPLTVLLFGERYADSAMILALLALGYYFNAALGFNGLTLRVFGKVRYLFVADLIMAAATLGVNLALIPRYGALGAAIGTCGTLIAQNLVYQIGLGFGTSISLFHWRSFKVYLLIIAGAAGVFLVQLLLSPPLYVAFGLATLASLAAIGVNRQSLKVKETFPEVLRFPLARWIFGG